MSNQLPQMPIGAKYADETTKGTNIDGALESSVKNVVVADIKAIDGAILSELKCGDIVSKEDATGKHAYVVTFKKDNAGLCLTYADGSGYIETVSYDYIDSSWVYNSTDIFNPSGADEGTLDKVLGFDSEGKIIKGTVSGGGGGGHTLTIMIYDSPGVDVDVIYADGTFKSERVMATETVLTNVIGFKIDNQYVTADTQTGYGYTQNIYNYESPLDPLGYTIIMSDFEYIGNYVEEP